METRNSAFISIFANNLLNDLWLPHLGIRLVCWLCVSCPLVYSLLALSRDSNAQKAWEGTRKHPGNTIWSLCHGWSLERRARPVSRAGEGEPQRSNFQHCFLLCDIGHLSFEVLLPAGSFWFPTKKKIGHQQAIPMMHIVSQQAKEASGIFGRGTLL